MTNNIPSKSDICILMEKGILVKPEQLVAIQFEEPNNKWWLKYHSFYDLLNSTQDVEPVKLSTVHLLTDEQWNHAWLQVQDTVLLAITHFLCLLREHELLHNREAFCERYSFVFNVAYNPLTIIVKENTTDLQICQLIQELPSHTRFTLKIYSSEDIQSLNPYDMGQLVSFTSSKISKQTDCYRII